MELPAQSPSTPSSTGAVLTSRLHVLAAPIGQQAASATAECFKGREREIGRFLALAADPDRLPRVVYVTGVPGVGKTALMEVVQQRMRAEGVADVLLVDTHEFDGSLKALNRLIAERAAPWPRLPGTAPLVLVLDGYDDLSVPQRRELRTGFIEGLDGPVLLVVCERQPPLDLIAAQVGWRSVIESMPLGPLSPAEAKAFLQAQGLSRQSADTIASEAHGNPLVLAIAGEAAHRTLDTSRWLDVLAEQVTRVLVTRLSHEGVDGDVLPLVESASLQAHLSEETLARMVGRDIAGDFWRFAELSVIERVGDDYAVAEPFRSLLARDLRRRRPRWCAEVDSRASSTVDAAPSHSAPTRGDWDATFLIAPFPPRAIRASGELIAGVRSALEWHRDRQFEPLGDLALCLGLTGDDAIIRVHRALVEIVRTMASSRAPQVSEAGRVLASYYFERLLNLEAVAERMSMSRATVFRRHKLGIELVAQRLANG